MDASPIITLFHAVTDWSPERRFLGHFRDLFSTKSTALPVDLPPFAR
jgi:hypothetical protein